MNYGFVIDNRKCIGCHACTVACKSEHDVPIGVNRTWVKYIEKGEFPNTKRVFSVMRCNHCADAPCVDICPVSALYTREDGIVDFDSNRCIGCKSCTQACPYDAIYMDPNSHTAAKCNYCSHRVDVGLEPSCVVACPEHAIISGNMDNPQSEISQLIARESVQVRKEEKGTLPKLFYIEGDAASLQPMATAVGSEYVQTAQTGGVGHFSHYIEGRDAQRQHTANQESWSQEVGENGGAPKRVYDAPAKGSLWGWEVSAYVWTKAIASGVVIVMLIASLFGLAKITDQIFWTGLGVGFSFLAITGGLLISDLDKPSRFLYVLLRPQWKSWLVKGAYSIVGFSFFVFAFGLARFYSMTSLTTIFGWLSLIFGVVVAIYTAFLFAQAKGRDFWQSPVLPFHMLAHAILAGASVLALSSIWIDLSPNWWAFLRWIMIGSLASSLAIVGIELLVPHSTQAAKKTVQFITRKPFGPIFWWGCVFLGLIFPLFLIFFSPAHTTLIWASAFSLLGILFTEHVWVRAPQLIPLS